MVLDLDSLQNLCVLVVVLQKWFTAKKRIPRSTMNEVRCWVVSGVSLTVQDLDPVFEVSNLLEIASLSIDINVSKPQSCKIIDIEAWFSWLQYNHQIQYGFDVVGMHINCLGGNIVGVIEAIVVVVFGSNLNVTTKTYRESNHTQTTHD